MTRRPAHRLLAIAVIAAPLALLPSVVSAHVVLEQSEVAAGTASELHFRAPIEKQGTTNRKIYALVPGPLVVQSCAVPSAAWRCTRDTTTRPGDTFVTWETAVAGSPQDLRFAFTVSVPSDAPATDLKLPVVQTYADGSVSRWIDDGEPSPAPRLAVLARGQAPANRPATGPGPNASSPSVTSGDRPVSPTAAPSVTAPSTQPTATTEATPRGDAQPSDGVVPSTAPTDLEAVEPTSTSRGSGPLAVGLVVAALAATAGGAVLLVRRRRAA